MRADWPHQLRAVEAVQKHWRDGQKVGVLVQPTGSGKTFTAMDMIRRASERGHRSAFLAERRVLVTQACRAARHFGIRAGAVMANLTRRMRDKGVFADRHATLQVCSRDTIHSRGDIPDGIKLLFVDEAHLFGSEGSQAIVEEFVRRGAYVLYLDATPVLPGGLSMGRMKNRWARPTFMVQPVMPSELLKGGQLVEFECWMPNVPELDGLDPDEDSEEARSRMDRIMGRDSLMEQVVEQYQIHGKGKRFLYFGYSVEDSKEIAKRFTHAEFRVRHVDGQTDDDEREEWYDQLEAGEIDGICNYGICHTGFDRKSVACIIHRRPTRVPELKIQIDGRGARRADGKDGCVMLDHAGVLWYHGRPLQDITYSLDPEWNFGAVSRAAADAPENRVNRCPRCGNAFTKSAKCPECGYRLSKRENRIQEPKGEPIARTMTKMPDRDDEMPFADEASSKQDQMGRAWRTYISIAVKRGLRVGFCVSRFKQQFKGKLPWDANVSPLPQEGQWGLLASEVWPNWGKAKA